MRDSTTYQAILDEGRAEGIILGENEGRAEGRMEEARRILLRLGRIRLGEANATIEAIVRATNDLERLELLVERVLDVKSWPELLAMA